MRNFLNVIRKFPIYMEYISEFSLFFMTALTILNIIARLIYKPITGTPEIIGYTMGILCSCALPFSVVKGINISVDFVTGKFSGKKRLIFRTITHITGIFLFSIAGWLLIFYGLDIKNSGRLSMELQFFIHPFIYLLAFCVITADIVHIIGIYKDVKRIYQK